MELPSRSKEKVARWRPGVEVYPKSVEDVIWLNLARDDMMISKLTHHTISPTLRNNTSCATRAFVRAVLKASVQ